MELRSKKKVQRRLAVTAIGRWGLPTGEALGGGGRLIQTLPYSTCSVNTYAPRLVTHSLDTSASRLAIVN